MKNDFTIIKNFYLEFEIKPEQRQKCSSSKIINIDNKFTEIQVYIEDIGEPPHFHLAFNKNYKTNNCCLRIDKNEQYLHGKHLKILMNKQLKKPNNILSENNFKTWKEIIKIWNKNNPNNKVKTDEGLLEVCGCPKDKCKEYAEYCKKVIERVDNK